MVWPRVRSLLALATPALAEGQGFMRTPFLIASDASASPSFCLSPICLLPACQPGSVHSVFIIANSAVLVQDTLDSAGKDARGP
ncbi:exported protein of unknown function [Candidatus Filomicrobium marinum]|uniref:Secreted protein n=1 Tax=Candidatus Filomicrobium marinum TaxID=1608628 RepID=A0A0D6JEQ8_9HYPH|nr:exported protein of unknown function [Candidatus Filomicrobium marinum]CPR18668.1 exported protein of unknown function [Candidatus Filomicrobium marinum]